MIELKEHERIDDLQRNGYKIIQNSEKFCFGMDAVLLSAFARVKKTDKVLDLGTGTGIIPLLLHARNEGRYYAVEIQPEMAEMAQRSVSLNKLEEEITIIQEDLKEITNHFKRESMDVVVTNPPYMKGNHGLVNPKDAKAISRHEICATLDDVIETAALMLHENGRFYMVHRPFRLAEIISKMKEVRLEPKRMQLVYPFIDKEPNMVLIEGIKGAGSELKIDKPLIVYKTPGEYTEEILEIYG